MSPQNLFSAPKYPMRPQLSTKNPAVCLTAAVVNRRFRQMLLADPGRALASRLWR
jgi:hypothetical protein